MLLAFYMKRPLTVWCSTLMHFKKLLHLKRSSFFCLKEFFVQNPRGKLLKPFNSFAKT